MTMLSTQKTNCCFCTSEFDIYPYATYPHICDRCKKQLILSQKRTEEDTSNSTPEKLENIIADFEFWLFSYGNVNKDAIGLANTEYAGYILAQLNELLENVRETENRES